MPLDTNSAPPSLVGATAAKFDASQKAPRPGARADAVSPGSEQPADAAVDPLFNRCRALWRQGDWRALAGYAVDDIERHSQRANLALMVATAHQALGQAAQTRLFVGLARQWGCEPQQVARALIAGVHNTLGRAMVAAGKPHHDALRHFADAVELEDGVAVGALTLHDRVRHQLGEMRLDTDASWMLAGPAQTTRAVPQLPSLYLESFEALCRSSELVSTRLKEQGEQLASIRRAIEGTVRKELANAVRQLEAHADLQRYLADGQLMPALHGWPVSPDFAVMLIEMIESNDYDLVIEFGSGASTLLMAIALARVAQRRQRKALAPQVAFEHLETFHHQTRSLLERVGVAQAVQLELAGLQPWTSAQGKEYAFYACESKLFDIVHALPGSAARALVVVDGPPAATGAHARYPALPIVLPLLQGLAFDMLLDDHARAEEQHISKTWFADLDTAKRRFAVSTHVLEKGACLIRVEA